MKITASPSQLLLIQNLKTYFDTEEGVVRAVDGVNLEIKKGETFAIVGESGCGKSVTALSIMRLLPPATGRRIRGSIILEDCDLMGFSEREMRSVRGRKISMIFQDPMTSLNPVHTIGQQIKEVLRSSLSSEEADETVMELLTAVGIPDPKQRTKEYPHQLSGGMKQRIMIAIALAGNPNLLIADEPTTALDVTIQAQILALLREIQQKRGMSILLITHDIGVVAEMADQVAVMYAGHIVENASAKNFFKEPKHPYSKKLFASIPNRMKRDRFLEIIKGSVPSLRQDFGGCRFSSRCDFSADFCFKEVPEHIRINSSHSVRCFLYDDHYKFPAMGKAPSQQTPSMTKSVSSGQPLLQIKHLKTYFPVHKGFFKRTVGHVKAVDGVSLTIKRGFTLALVGESGCGKTTVGKSIIQLISPTSGEIIFEEIDLSRLAPKSLRSRRSKFQIVFQDSFSAMNPRMTIRQIISEGMISLLPSVSVMEQESRIDQLLQKVGLIPEYKNRYPHEFSGGQRQRICMARALAVNPDLIVCDEPTSSLDVSIQAQILNLLKTLQQDLGLSFLFITHNLSVVEYLAHQVAVMYLGHIVESAPTEKLFDNPRHPYTLTLLSAIPSLEPGKKNEYQAIVGDVPSPFNPPPGCKFQARCPLVEDLCRCREIEFYQVSEGHSVRCWKVV